MATTTVNAVLDDLNANQRRAVASDAAPLCILAGAGSGKTRVLTRRIAYRISNGSAGAGHVLALTFTRKAAGELGSRLRALGVRDAVSAGTFHAIAYAQLRRRWADRGETEPGLLDRKARIIAPFLRGPQHKDIQAADIAGEIEWAKARMVNPSAYPAAARDANREPPLALDDVAELYRRYEVEKNKRGLVDFDDLLFRTAKAIEEDADFAAAQRWRFRHFFVDEFQDVNPVQHRLLMAWLGDRLDLCVVGDPNQAIYAWNGADASYLTRFGRRYRTADTVRLDDNYRSSPEILAAANAVLADGGVHSPPLRANCPSGPAPAVRSYPDERAEAAGVATLATEAHAKGAKWSDIAALVRTNAQAVPLERALTKAGIPVRVRADGAFLRLPEVAQALRRLQTGSLPDRLAELEADLPTIQPEDRRANVVALVGLANEYVAGDQAPSVAGFLAWATAALRGDTHTGADEDAVEIVTFHRAKGLEWPVVFVCGMERGLVPIGRAETPAERAEERRLLYVALTRAERELHCSWAEERTFGTKTVRRQQSPWLFLIGEGDERLPLKPTRPRAAPRASDSPLLADLKAWRRDKVRASNAPAYTVFDDKTLAAIANHLPRTERQLLDVPGIGPVKLSRYGDEVLAIVAKHGS